MHDSRLTTTLMRHKQRNYQRKQIGKPLFTLTFKFCSANRFKFSVIADHEIQVQQTKQEICPLDLQLARIKRGKGGKRMCQENIAERPNLKIYERQITVTDPRALMDIAIVAATGWQMLAQCRKNLLLVL